MLNKLLALVLIALVVVGCGNAAEQAKQNRVEVAKQAHVDGKDIVIGVVGSSASDKRSIALVNGAQLAVDEINAKGGIRYKNAEGIEQERHFRLVIQYEDDYQWRYFYARRRNKAQAIAVDVANAFASDENLIAVLGHGSSSIAIPASVVYEEHGILYLSPFATNIALTRHNFQMTFRTIPDNYQQAQQTAGYCAKFRRYKNMAVLYTRNSLYAEELTDMFEDTAVKLGMRIIYRRSFLASNRNYSALLADLRSVEDVDAIFLVASYEPAAALITQAREAGIEAPFVGSDGLVKPEVYELAGRHVEGLVAPVPFNPHFNIAQPFRSAYYERFNEEPSYAAAQGYDGISLLIHAIENIKPNPPTPLRLATEIRYMPYWIGVTGLHIFDRDGNIEGKKYYFWELRDDNYYVIPGANLPAIRHNLRNPMIKREVLNLD